MELEPEEPTSDPPPTITFTLQPQGADQLPVTSVDGYDSLFDRDE